MKPLDPATALARRGGLVLLDVRDEAAFRAGHLAGAGNIPQSELMARRAELPSRETPLLVLAQTAARAAEAASDLEARGHGSVYFLDAPLASLEGGLADRDPPAPLWRPAPFLAWALPRLPRGRAADLAAGTGREAVFLALNGFEVEAWDWDEEALRRTRALAARNGVSIETVVADLEREQVALPENRYRLVTVFRFLHRPLFPAIERALEPGGHLVYESFLVGQRRFRRPRKRRFLLEPGELPARFPHLEILHYEEADPEGGPVTARLLARRTG